MVLRKVASILIALFGACATGGCAGQPRSTDTPDVIFIIPGAAGRSVDYSGIVNGLRDAGIEENIRYVDWGAPSIMFMLNYSNESIHRDAEIKVVNEIESWRRDHPNGKISLIGHSAGGGVALGAAGRLDGLPTRLDRLIVLAPSVSPGYDLSHVLNATEHPIQVFYSDRDTVFLKWRTGNFGTYDNVKTPAAGNLGFASIATLPERQQSRVIQHPYDESWKALGNDGGHFGTIGREFARTNLAPLFKN